MLNWSGLQLSQFFKVLLVAGLFHCKKFWFYFLKWEWSEPLTLRIVRFKLFSFFDELWPLVTIIVLLLFSASYIIYEWNFALILEFGFLLRCEMGRWRLSFGCCLLLVFAFYLFLSFEFVVYRRCECFSLTEAFDLLFAICKCFDFIGERCVKWRLRFCQFKQTLCVTIQANTEVEWTAAADVICNLVRCSCSTINMCFG